MTQRYSNYINFIRLLWIVKFGEFLLEKSIKVFDWTKINKKKPAQWQALTKLIIEVINLQFLARQQLQA
jgi:hypothetical protein